MAEMQAEKICIDYLGLEYLDSKTQDVVFIFFQVHLSVDTINQGWGTCGPRGLLIWPIRIFVIHIRIQHRVENETP